VRLVTIRFSHYNEKARWALDLAGVPYTEEGHLPGFHVRAVKRRHPGGGDRDKASSRFSTPLLVLDDGSVLTDSAAIVAWASDRMPETLYPSDEVREIEQDVHDRLAVHSRRVVYGFLFSHPPTLRRLARACVPGFESWVLAAALPFTARRGYEAFAGGDEGFARSRRICAEEVERWGARLDGRSFLVGDRLTAADLALACAMVPLLIPQAEEGFGAPLLPVDALQPEARDLVVRFRGTAAGRHALRMFAEHRGTRVIPYGERAP